jgi:hypothetical protein
MSLHVLAYNLKRVIGILGIAKAMKAMKLAKVGGPCDRIRTTRRSTADSLDSSVGSLSLYA